MPSLVGFFFQAEDGIRDVERSRGLGDVYKRQKLDRTQLIRVITNLVKNAIQAVPEVENPRILVTVASEEGLVKISVADNGVGIEDEFKDKIFEPKFTTKSSGMGLGLGMVKNIVENYKGTIQFVSEKDKGTVFTVKFPKD